jgi:hypothetical protein
MIRELFERLNRSWRHPMTEENHDNKDNEPLSKLEKTLWATVLGAAAAFVGFLWMKRTAAEADRRAAERNLPKLDWPDGPPPRPTNPVPDDLRLKPGVIFPPGEGLLGGIEKEAAARAAERDAEEAANLAADDAARRAADDAARRAADDAARRAADDAARRAADDAARRAADRR